MPRTKLVYTDPRNIHEVNIDKEAEQALKDMDAMINGATYDVDEVTTFLATAFLAEQLKEINSVCAILSKQVNKRK